MSNIFQLGIIHITSQETPSIIYRSRYSKMPPPLLLPVFYFHGVLQDASSGASFAAKMSAEGRRFVPLSFASGPSASIRALSSQVPLAIAQIRDVVASEPETFADGYAFIGYSQGGMLARAVVQSMDDHNVRVLVTLAGVLNGLYYGPQSQDLAALDVFLRELGPELVPPSVFDFAQYCSPQHQSLGDRQATVAVPQLTLAQTFQAAFDAFVLAHPDLQQRYSYFNVARSPVTPSWTTSNAFLATLNNVGVSDDADAVRRRANFLKLDAAHLFASPADGLLAPWQASILGQYSEVDSTETLTRVFGSLRVLDMKATREYVDDTYGLRTLDERNGLHLHVLPNVLHDNWTTDDVREGTMGFSELYEHHIRSVLQVGGSVTR